MLRGLRAQAAIGALPVCASGFLNVSEGSMWTFGASEAGRDAGAKHSGGDAAGESVEGPLGVAAAVLGKDAEVRVVPALGRVGQARVAVSAARAPRLEAPYVLCGCSPPTCHPTSRRKG